MNEPAAYANPIENEVRRNGSDSSIVSGLNVRDSQNTALTDLLNKLEDKLENILSTDKEGLPAEKPSVAGTFSPLAERVQSQNEELGNKLYRLSSIISRIDL